MALTVLRDTRRRLYCGPTAICAVTGQPASRVLATIEEARGPRAFGILGYPKGVTGMPPAEVVATIKEFGFRAQYYEHAKPYPTLRKFMADTRRPFGTLIVHVTGHYVTIDERHLIDNHTKTAVPHAKAPWQRKHVKGYITITKGRG